MKSLPSSVLDVLVDGEEEHEEEEDPGAAKEVPDVVPEKQCQLGAEEYGVNSWEGNLCNRPTN